MSKTVAAATVSTQCGFTNGAGRTVTYDVMILGKTIAYRFYHNMTSPAGQRFTDI